MFFCSRNLIWSSSPVNSLGPCRQGRPPARDRPNYSSAGRGDPADLHNPLFATFIYFCSFSLVFDRRRSAAGGRPSAGPATPLLRNVFARFFKNTFSGVTRTSRFPTVFARKKRWSRWNRSDHDNTSCAHTHTHTRREAPRRKTFTWFLHFRILGGGAKRRLGRRLRRASPVEIP